MPFTSRKQFFYLLYNEPEVFMEWVEDYGVPKEFKVGSTEHWLMQIKKMDPKRSMTRMKKKMLRGAESFGAERRTCILCKTSQEIVGDGGFETFEGKKMSGAVCGPCEYVFVAVTDKDYDLPNTKYVMGAESFEAEDGTRKFQLTDITYDTFDEDADTEPFYDEEGNRQSYHPEDIGLPEEGIVVLQRDEWINREQWEIEERIIDKWSDETGWLLYGAVIKEITPTESFEAEDKRNCVVCDKLIGYVQHNQCDGCNGWMCNEACEVQTEGGYGDVFCKNCFTKDAENWGGDPEGPLAKALEKARKKSRQPKKPLVIESMWYKRVDPKDPSRYYYSKGNRPEYTEDDIKYGAYIRSGGGTWNEEQNAKGFGWDNNLGRLVRLPDDLTFSAEEQIHEDTLTNKEIKTNVVYPLLLGILGGTIATVVGNLWSIEIAKKRGHL